MRRFGVAALSAVSGLAASSALASVPIFGGPTWDSTSGTGYLYPGLASAPNSTAGNGTAVGYAAKYSGYTYLGPRAVRWDASGAAATELGTLGTDDSGRTTSFAFALNTAGTAVGSAAKFSGNTSLGDRAVRWDASGTAATELGNLGTDGSGVTSSAPRAINTAGTAVGWATKYSGDTYLGARAVRWDASGTAATELGNLGTNSGGVTSSEAYAINTAGTAVGYANKYSGNSSLGASAVRWDASGTAATELGTLGTNGSGYTNSHAYAINISGTAVGFARKYSGNSDLGARAVRWDASGTFATELGNLGTDGSGITESFAYAINSAGTAVGYAYKYGGNTSLGTRAVYWGLDGLAVDLNTLLSPADAAMWTLRDARGISDTNWITGIGGFDPDGPGGLAAYSRMFLIQIPAPSAAGPLALGGLIAAGVARRRRRR